MINTGGLNATIDNEEEMNHYVDFLKQVTNLKNNFSNIDYVQMVNEPNIYSEYQGGYLTNEELKWYTKIIETLYKNMSDSDIKNNIVLGELATISKDSSKSITTEKFIKTTAEYGLNKYATKYSVHIYDSTDGYIQDKKFSNSVEKFQGYLKTLGGFIQTFITEYGLANNDGSILTEEAQAERLVQETITLDKYNARYATIYNFHNVGTDTTNREHSFGLVNYDYTPKLSYYTIKTLLTNTNGSEYTGNLNLQQGLEAHVYNKDGKPLIIAWSDNTDNTYDFTLNNMKAKDVYGKDIKPNENGKITITTSPVYLYNVDTNYFYKSISNVATTKYQEFETNFQDQISKVSGLQSSINTLKERMQNLSTVSNLDETTAINLMKQHYNLGNTIIQSYKSKTLQIEFVKLSSMLDALDDIGNTFEDLVTVSAKTRNANLTETQKLITEAENLTNDTELEMIYPNKILQFSKDYYEKSSYINSVKEENDIKTGLIVSKNLHSKLLAEWSIQFANLYIDDYITTNPVKIIYTTTAPTNQNVIATLQTNANITITNNSNSKTHTFEENGTFTFEYTIKGQAFQKTATVNNIDKKAPVITEVQNGRLYTQNITPKIYDENLQEVLLYKDNILSQNYKTNTTISEDGSYRLIATDKAGNQTTIEFDICKNPATIKYSTKELTNQDVTVTLDSKYEIEETNNSNKTTYTFTENGEFTFKFKIKGTELRLTAYVGNIDKTPPTITGVENGRLYMDKATPIIADENLKGVKLYLNSHKVENYTSGIELTEEGFYKIIAIDNAGNETITEFAIMESMDREYKIKDNYILNIKNNTNKSDFDKNLKMPIKYEIFRDENKLTENDKIATGDLLITDGGERYTLIVNGDMNKDGYVNIKDVIKLRKYLLERNNIDEVSLLAADCNLDGKSINIKDLIKMRLIVLQRDVT